MLNMKNKLAHAFDGFFRTQEKKYVTENTAVSRCNMGEKWFKSSVEWFIFRGYIEQCVSKRGTTCYRPGVNFIDMPYDFGHDDDMSTVY